jgi:hypothetical protein
MSRFPAVDEIIAAYEDQVEALERLLRARTRAVAESASRFFGLTIPDLQARLAHDREELDRWALLVVVASFEATLRSDARARIDARTKDVMRKPLRDLFEEHDPRVRLEDILVLWEGRAPVGGKHKQAIRALLKHRHWLAHGRHWTNKHGLLPTPMDARADIDDYARDLQILASDFPLG